MKYKLSKILFIFFLFVRISDVFTEETHHDESKKNDTKSLAGLKEILANDQLIEEKEKKAKEADKVKQEVLERKKAEFRFPDKNDFWKMASETWIVKNISKLKWDFQKPDYGLDVSFSKFLSEQGYHEQKFQILLINSPNVTHFALPGGNDGPIFILSTPFIQALDLSKTEISILLFEDFYRLKNEYFQNYIRSKNKELFELIGKNFYDSKLSAEHWSKLMNSYEEFIYNVGFNFSEQFKITEELGKFYKYDLKVWNTYLNVLKKIDILVSTNYLYQDYSKIYPSPQMQIKWLAPEIK